MKKILSVLTVAVLLFSCNNNTSSPSNTVDAFFSTIKKGDISGLKTLVTKSDVQLLQMAEQFTKAFEGLQKEGGSDKLKDEMMAKSKDMSYTIKDEKIDGDKATVNVEIKDKDKTETKPISLLKEDGKWKVSLISTGLGMGGKQNSTENVQQAMDSLKTMLKDVNVDSVANSMKDLFKEAGKNKEKLEEIGKKMEEAAKEFEKTQK